MNILKLAAACMLAAGAASAQEPTQDDVAAASAMWKELDAGRYLAADAAIRGKAFGPDGQPKPGFIYDHGQTCRGC